MDRQEKLQRIQAMTTNNRNVISDIKEKPIENTDLDKTFQAMKLNKILDFVQYGVGTYTNIEINGIELELRILSAQENFDIESEVIKFCDENNIRDDIRISLRKMLVTLYKANTKSPVKEKSKETLTLEDLGWLPLGMLNDLFEIYANWVKECTIRPTQMSEDERINIEKAVKKKPELLNTLDLLSLRQIARSLAISCRSLEEKMQSVLNT
jgi:hypothetical protein